MFLGSNFNLDTGSMAPSIKEQLSARGFSFQEDSVERFDKIKDSLNVLFYNEFMEEHVYKRLCRRLVVKVDSHLSKINKVVNA